MSKSVAGILVTIVALVVLGGIYLANRTDQVDQHDEQMTSSGAAIQQSSDTAELQKGVMSGTVEMGIVNSAYAQPDIRIKKGTTVTWTNQDNIQHDVAPDEESDSFKKSELLSKGESYSFTFDDVGTYTYHCTPHPFMKGKIEVVE